MIPTSHRRASALWVLTVLLFSGAVAMWCGTASAAQTSSAAAHVEHATWVQRKLQFIYMGFTTHYSCYGLRDQVVKALIQLGARRKDLKVHPMGCVRGLGRPEPAPGLIGTFYVLVPVSSRGTKHAAAQPVVAHWRTVDVRLARSALNQAGQCELMQQIKQKVLPLFTHRNVRFTSNCIPHELQLPGATLRVEVLKAEHAGP